MATRSELESKIINADAAGDEEAVRMLVQELRGLPQGNQFWPGMKIAGQSAVRGLRQIGAQAISPTMNSPFAMAKFGAPTTLDPNRLKERETAIASVQSEIDESKKKNAPILDTPSGFWGNIAGNVGLYAPTAFIPGVNTLAGATGLGLLSGMIAPVASDESRATNVGIGGGAGFLGQGLATAFGTGVRGIRNRLTPEANRLVGVLEREGLNLTPAQKTGNKAFQTIDSVLDYLPFSHGPQQKIHQEQAQAFNKAVSKTYGDVSGDLTQGATIAQRKLVGERIGDITAKIDIPQSPALLTKLDSALNEAKNLVPEQQKIVESRIFGLLAKADPNTDAIPGKAYQSWRTRVNEQIGADPSYLGRVLGQVRSAVDDAAADAAPPGLAEPLAKARSQYAHIKTIQPIANKSTTGEISPSLLFNSLSQNEKLPALRDLAQAGKTFLRDPTPNSGTAQRFFYQSALTGDNPAQRLALQAALTGGSAGAGGGIGAARGDDPYMGAGIAAALSLLGPRALQAAIHSQVGNRMITGGVTGGIPALTDDMIMAAIRNGTIGGLLGYSSANR